MSTRLRSLLAAALVAAAVLVPIGAAGADDGDLGTRLRAACVRVPVAQARVTGAITRLEGPVEVRGSLLWIRAAIDAATAEGRPRRAQDLQTRLDVLTARLQVLHLQSDRLDRAAGYCAAQGVPA